MSGTAVLDLGVFLGDRVRALTAGDFRLAHWTANGPQARGSHVHREAHFLFVLSGDYVTEARGRRDASSTPLTYVPPGTVHDDHLVAGAGSFISISVPASLSRDGARASIDAQVWMSGARAQMLAFRLARELSCGSPPDLRLLEAYCVELLDQVWAVDGERVTTGWLAAARDALADPHASMPSLRALSRSLGVHPVHLTRSFLRVFGCTPREYSSAIRLSAAADMITRDAESLADIAIACGFADQSHLTNQFRRAYGVSPAQYRARTSARRSGRPTAITAAKH